MDQLKFGSFVIYGYYELKSPQLVNMVVRKNGQSLDMDRVSTEYNMATGMLTVILKDDFPLHESFKFELIHAVPDTENSTCGA